MNVLFSLDYATSYGEELVLNVKGNVMEGRSVVARHNMRTIDGRVWTAQLCLGDTAADAIDYYYSVERGGTVLLTEWTAQTHRLELNCRCGANYTVYDHWTGIPEDSYLYSSAFTGCINRRQHKAVPQCKYEQTVRLKVRAPQMPGGETLLLTGAGEALGAWDVQKAVPMYEHLPNEWVADIDASLFKTRSMECKFVTANDDRSKIMWETDGNRIITLPKMQKGDVVVYSLTQAFLPISNTRCAGTLVPVFSLRSEESFGVGDFGDLKKMVAWVAATRQRVLQILPVNDTTTTHTWTDSYPYSCISIFALHPQYICLGALPQLRDMAERNKFEALRKELNGLRQIDYERVNNAKRQYLRLLFAQEGKAVMASAGFKAFFREAGQWLVPYAQYCHLRDTLGNADISTWKGHERWNEADRQALSSPRTKAYKDVEFYYFVQYLLNRQMEEAHEYARQKGVILKGDIPIGVNRNGCDVWQEPRYFNLNGQAGAPPDDFSVNGQNWGFPTYNWDEMVKDGCQWWVRRFKNMAKFFDAYRIDHVLGFFRIWEIPVDAVHGLLGHFSPALAMSREEIEQYGLNFQEQLFTEPFIADWVLERVFGHWADMVRRDYLDAIGDGRYRMKPAYNTQRKVEAAFAGKASADDIWVRDGLYALISDVLFVRDHKNPDMFHPRISVQFDFIYESLYDCDKAAFNKLYNDYFYRRNNQFWYHEAMKKLPELVQATGMLVCAEDLGMVPDSVAWVMNELKILSLELQSMPKDPKTRFGYLPANPYRSVCTISSPDMPTLRMWWDEDYTRTQAYYNSVMCRGGEAPHPLPSWLARDIIANHLSCPSMLCILAIQDWLAIDKRLRLPDANAERVNIPANPKHYWRYRMHLSVEQLLQSDELNDNIAGLIVQGGRG